MGVAKTTVSGRLCNMLPLLFNNGTVESVVRNPPLPLWYWTVIGLKDGSDSSLWDLPKSIVYFLKNLLINALC